MAEKKGGMPRIKYSAVFGLIINLFERERKRIGSILAFTVAFHINNKIVLKKSVEDNVWTSVQ
jgi:hypothetical protein